MNTPGFRITGGKGFHVTFKNGWTISVQFGPGNYCDNYAMDFVSFYNRKGGADLESTTAEIAYWGPDGVMQAFPDAADTVKGRVSPVKGRVSPEDVLALMQEIAAR